MKEIVIRGRAVYGGVAIGEALVSPMPMMGWGNVKPELGYTVEREHPLKEVPLKDKILVLPFARGSGGFVMYGGTTRYGTNPAAVLVNQVMSITILMAMNLKRPVLTDIDRNPLEVIETGDYVEVNGDEGFVKIYKGGKPG